jgi:hypothetical protein
VRVLQLLLKTDYLHAEGFAKPVSLAPTSNAAMKILGSFYLSRR